MSEKWSKIQKQALNYVAAKFRTAEFSGNFMKIQDYCDWARKVRGPAIHVIPTLQACTGPNDPNYAAPQGLFESEQIMAVAKRFHKLADGRELGFKGGPCGLIALVATALQRAYKSYQNGRAVVPPPFTHDNYWENFKGHIEDASKFSDKHWDRILQIGERVVKRRLSSDVEDDECAGGFFVPSPSKPH